MHPEGNFSFSIQHISKAYLCTGNLHIHPRTSFKVCHHYRGYESEPWKNRVCCPIFGTHQLERWWPLLKVWEMKPYTTRESHKSNLTIQSWPVWEIWGFGALHGIYEFLIFKPNAVRNIQKKIATRARYSHCLALHLSVIYQTLSGLLSNTDFFFCHNMCAK